MRSKKKIGLSALGGVLLAVTAFSAYRTYDAYATLKQESNLLLENLEALAIENESGGSEYEYPDGYPYPVTCNVKTGPRRWNRCKVEIITCQGGGSGCNSKDCPSHPSL